MIVLNKKFEIFKNIFAFMHSLNSSAKKEARRRPQFGCRFLRCVFCWI